MPRRVHMKEFTNQKYGKCLVLDRMLFEYRYCWKPIFLFNQKAFVPVRQEGLVHMLEVFLSIKEPHDLTEKKSKIFMDTFEFDSHYLYDSFESSEQQSLLAWRWLLYLEVSLRRIMRERLSNLDVDWKAVLRKCYPEGYLSDDFSTKDALDFAAARAQEVLVGSAFAASRGYTLLCNEFMSLLSRLPIYEKFDIDLFKESLFDEKKTASAFREPYKIVQNFTMSSFGSTLNKNINFLPFVFTREVPAINDLSYNQIFKLRNKKKIGSLYRWLFRRASKKHFDLENAMPVDVADFLQNSLWELISSIAPHIKSTVAKIVISNIPGLPINPVSLTFDIKSLLHEKRLTENFEGLFILSSLCNEIDRQP